MPKTAGTWHARVDEGINGMTIEVRRTQTGGSPARNDDSRAPGDLDTAVRGVGLAPAFQPIVALPSGAVVGFEALARWPALPELTPTAVFARAEATGQLEQLDQACIEATIIAALRHPLGREALLCVNCEPTSAAVTATQSLTLERGGSELQVMFELTERSLLTHPHALLAKVSALREQGFAIALDDVGAHPDSLSLLDVLRPDVIKLDLGLVQFQPDHDRARTLSAVWAHHERTGAVILAEGIETDEHLEQALTVGATLGQGYLFGRPGPLGHVPPATGWSPQPSRSPRTALTSGSPFDLVKGLVPTRTGRKETLTAFSRLIEHQARQATDPPILLTALQRAPRFTGRTRDDYRDFAVRSPLVAVFGEDLPTDLGPGIRGVAVDAGDALAMEWTVVTLGPHTAAALIAREHDDNREHHRRDGDRRFEFVITYDRTVVTAAACNLLDRIT